ncbi:hypothetical protein ElyMa_006938900 [Elysia marginata]|uniref:Secreted protein n=1 Tax=Elysia marginata TaxID=1093978 RepID=A0AAV4JH31_9GAST|nr:hypothetical protein ElyMa_006938900 [Elysia marginata]
MVVATPMMMVVTTAMMPVVTSAMMPVVTSPMTMVAMIQVHRYFQLAAQGCKNVRPSKSKALGLWKCAALHGQPTTKAARPHTHRSLSRFSRCRLTASQYRSSSTVKTNSTVRQRRQGFSLTKSIRPSSDRLRTLQLTPTTHSCHTESRVQKNKTLCGAETDLSLTPHLPVRCESRTL